MRWIVISLVLINLLIFGWRWWPSEEEQVLTTDVAKPIAPVEPAIELLPDGVVTPSNSIESADSHSSAVDTAANPLVEAVPAAETLSAPAATSAVPAVPNPAEPAAKPDPTAAAVTIPATGTSTASPVPVPTPAPPVPVQHCAWTDWQAVPAKAEMAAEVVEEQTREQEVARSYLAYIPAKASRELTLARLAEIKALGLEAAFLNKGPQVGGISLGLFSKPESLQTRLAELKTAGVEDAQGVERIRTEPQRRQFWRWTGEKTPSAVINQQLVSCNDVAPTPSGQ